MWKTIRRGYQVNELGEVLSTKRKEPRRLTPYWWQGRLAVSLSIDGKSVPHPVHLLVLRAFRPANNDGKHYAAFKDGDAGNVQLSNLEWRQYRARLGEEKRAAVRRDDHDGWGDRAIADRQNLPLETVRKILGRRHRHRPPRRPAPDDSDLPNPLDPLGKD